MNIAIFGGTFDPIHSGHVRAAQRAARKYRLHKVLFVPTGHPPHKHTDELTCFEHRYAMVALACAGYPRFFPSLLEAPRTDGRPYYSVETVRRVKRALGPRDRLYFIIGADAFLDLPHWKDFRRLLEMADFIVVSRPAFAVENISRVVPASLVRSGVRPARDRVRLAHSTLHILRGVNVPVASTEIREAVRKGRKLTGHLPPLVEQYIRKEGLYRPPKARDKQ